MMVRFGLLLLLVAACVSSGSSGLFECTGTRAIERIS